MLSRMQDGHRDTRATWKAELRDRATGMQCELSGERGGMRDGIEDRGKDR